ncbi:MAG: hypothetical protein HY735_11350 [Verrucomicrobia bacterium]|nr:hypothetical protein [Verrucomicrobiota bacterium]
MKAGQLFQSLHAGGLTLIVVTHNPRLAEVAERQLRLEAGRIVEPSAKFES